MSIPKPNLRGLLASKTKGQLVFASIMAFISVGSMRLWQQTYTRDVTNNFYKYTDFEAEAERMKKQGVFRSVGPNGEVKIENYQ